MHEDLIRARQLLETGEYTCVLCSGTEIRTCTARGVRPLVELHHERTWEGFCAADKVVGKATAFLYVLLGVQEVYTRVASEAAVQILIRHHIPLYYDQCVRAIFNRNRTGLCPMETAVRDIDDPVQALCAVEDTLRKMLHHVP